MNSLLFNLLLMIFSVNIILFFFETKTYVATLETTIRSVDIRIYIVIFFIFDINFQITSILYNKAVRNHPTI